ncbi:MAG: hypothetical protein ABS949_06585 [Solibacillus sp.]
MKKFLYIILSFIAGALLMLTATAFFNAREQKQAIVHTEHYLAEHYPELNYEILGVYTSTEFKHYGYFKHSVSVRDADKIDIFEVYYDKHMDRMEDSRAIREKEQFLADEITPKVEQYVKEQFGEVRYIDVYLYMETGKPTILVKFNEGDAAISRADFDAFMVFVKEQLVLEHAHIIMDYWMGEVSFNEEF